MINSNSKLNKQRLLFCFGTILWFTLLLISPSWADTPPAAPPNTRLWNLNNVDIHTVTEEISRETGKNFLIDPRVSGKINLISAHPMSAEEIYPVFLSMLQVLGFSAIPSGDANGNIIKIVPSTEALRNAATVNGSHTPSSDEMIVQVIPVKNISAVKLVPILRPLLPEGSNLAAYELTNSLIISGTARNVQRAIKIVHDIDKANTHHIEIIPLKQATASQIVNTVGTLQGNNTDPSNNLILTADDHTNSILMSGDEQHRVRMRALIAQLDVPSPAGSKGNTQVIYLHYLKAKDFAVILNKIAQNEGDEASSETSSGPKITASVKAPSKNNVSIQAEPTTNAIIITAPPAMMATLKTVVARLDDRPAQVLVEAAIVEISEAALNKLGILWGQLANERVPGSDVVLNTTGLPTGFNPGIGVIKNGNLREVVNLLANTAATNILSTPSVLVMDNQQAKIEVGKTLSIETGSYSNTNGTNSSVSPFNTFERDKIGLHLYVTPQINRGDAVQLDIDQGNETLENPTNPGTTPITNTTLLKTTVLVNNGDILVLGGLISNSLTKGQTKIPLIGDIPFIGAFFTYNTNTLDKKNLMIFLKPSILHTNKNNEQATANKYNFIRSQQLRIEEPSKFTGVDPNIRVLPLWQGDTVLPKPFSK